MNNSAWFVSLGSQFVTTSARRELHQRLIAEQIDAAPNVEAERKAIVLAGPPGAGKSTRLNEILGAQRDKYLVIDADEFKQGLLHEALDDGTYESWIKPEQIHERQRAGERFFPLELASLVHEESSMLAGKLRETALGQGTNIVVDTVLSSDASAQALGRQLTAAGYSVEVIDVEVPFEISESRIAQRWQQSYESALKSGDGLGGRWVPSEYARGVFDGADGRSKPEIAAEVLAHNCPNVMRYRVYRTTQEATDQVPAVGGWEKDLSRVKAGGPLLDSALAAIAKRVAVARPQRAAGKRPPSTDLGRG
ncbi:zeta toxin family protein [Mycetocola saprophilus]|uniref:zeta toxin family protein n=1 Tax=Mycetocola saprophilus TaxID=76636 RepID=UPI003BEF96FF